jgi:AraC-like DNA-binding protein
MTWKKQPWEESTAKRIYDYMCRRYFENGLVPSSDEVCERFGLSKSTWHYNMGKLEGMKLVERPLKHGKGGYRGIMLAGALHLPPVEFIPDDGQRETIDAQLTYYRDQLIKAGGLAPDVLNPKAPDNPN